jgi:cytochrome c-type biogenesis protein CcmH/NrfG
MIFLIILIISFISILYVFKNYIIKLSNERKSIYKIQNITFIFIVLFLFTLSSLIYNYVGNPFINIKELYSQRDKLKETEAQKNKNFDKNLQKFNELNIALKKEPNNIQILLKLAEVASKVNKIEAEIASLTKLNSINSSPKIKSLLAQAIVRKANGQVTTKAKKLVDEVLIENPLDPGANFLNGLRQSQIGNEDEALKIWIKLYNSTIKNDTWKKNLEINIKSAAKNIGISQKEINIQLKSNKNINNDVATNILNLSEKEQKIRIYGMVEQLASRLTKEKDDFEGWIRLFNSYKYLQENDKALLALRTAIEIKPSIILKQTLLKELLPPQDKPKFTLETDKLIDDILIKEPNNVDALFFKGLKAFNNGENNTAKLYWNKLIATLPPNSKISLELIKKLETLEK